MPHVFRKVINLDQKNREFIWDTLATVGDDGAHRFEVGLCDAEKRIDLSGASVQLIVRRADKKDRILAGSIENNYAIATLDEHCYALAGQVRCTVLIKVNGSTLTGVRAYLDVAEGLGGSVVDPEGHIPNLTDLLNELKNLRDATKKANDVVSHPPRIDDSTKCWSVWNATHEAYENTGVSAVGANGYTPRIGENGHWFVGDNDTGVEARGPAGKNGDGAGTVTAITANGQKYEPDETGNVDLGIINSENDNSSVPAGGLAGQVLGKISNEDGDVGWITPPSSNASKLPDGGTAGQTLVKQSDEDGDAQWDDLDLANATYSDPDSEGVSEDGHVMLVNSDLLGGKPPEYYTSAGGLKSDPREEETDPETGNPLPINANQLGGVDASEYLQKSNVVNNCTTEAEGFVADARALKTLRDMFGVVKSVMYNPGGLFTAPIEFYKVGKIVYLHWNSRVTQNISGWTAFGTVPEGYRIASSDGCYFLDTNSKTIRLRTAADGGLSLDTSVPADTLMCFDIMYLTT